MIIEFFGLSRTGKTIMRKNLDNNNYHTITPDEISNVKKLSLFLKSLISNPLSSFYLFYVLNTNNISKNIKVIGMRNSYLASVLLKNERIKNNKKMLFIDEFSLQSLFMILQKKSNKEKIEKIMNKLPKNDKLLVFEYEGRKEIYKKPHEKFDYFRRSNPTMLPGGHINLEYAKKWMENMEHNYKIIKEIILEKYEKDKNKEINEIIAKTHDKTKEKPKLYSTKL